MVNIGRARVEPELTPPSRGTISKMAHQVSARRPAPLLEKRRGAGDEKPNLAIRVTAVPRNRREVIVAAALASGLRWPDLLLKLYRC